MRQASSRIALLPALGAAGLLAQRQLGAPNPLEPSAFEVGAGGLALSQPLALRYPSVLEKALQTPWPGAKEPR